MASKRFFVIPAALLMVSGGCASAVSHPPSEMALVPTERLVFADEFDKATLDRSKWMVVGPDFWVNQEEQAYIDSPETIRFQEGASGGSLVLQPVFRKGFTTPTGRKADFISGRITTKEKFDFTYGRAVARIRVPEATGVWPAFWLLGNGKWPETGEIDIMEYLGEPDWVAVALHGTGYSGETPLVNKYFFAPDTDATAWHEYEVDWDADRLLFKVDGQLIYRVTRPMVEFYGRWRFDTPKHLILNFAVGGVYPFKTNGIHSPYNGVPMETVERIQSGEVAMQVDWVRVYKRGS